MGLLDTSKLGNEKSRLMAQTIQGHEKRLRALEEAVAKLLASLGEANARVAVLEERASSSEAARPSQEPATSEEESVDSLRKKLAELGVRYSPAAKIERLREQLAEAMKHKEVPDGNP